MIEGDMPRYLVVDSADYSWVLEIAHCYLLSTYRNGT